MSKIKKTHLIVYCYSSFYHCLLQVSVNSDDGNFVTLNLATLKAILDAHIIYWVLALQYEFYTLPDRRVSSAKDYGKNY